VNPRQDTGEIHGGDLWAVQTIDDNQRGEEQEKQLEGKSSVSPTEELAEAGKA
jgi:hypothetical protein